MILQFDAEPVGQLPYHITSIRCACYPDKFLNRKGICFNIDIPILAELPSAHFAGTRKDVMPSEKVRSIILGRHIRMFMNKAVKPFFNRHVSLMLIKCCHMSLMYVLTMSKMTSGLGNPTIF